MATTGHTVKAFDDDLSELRAIVSEMGGRAEAAIELAMSALTKRDVATAQKVIDADRRIDELEAEVDRLVVRLIALRAPMADDLREVLAALKISGLIERMGDYAKNIAKRVAIISDNREIEAVSLLPAMAGPSPRWYAMCLTPSLHATRNWRWPSASGIALWTISTTACFARC